VMRLGFLHSQVVGASFRLSFGNGTETGLKDSEKKKKNFFFFSLSLFLAAVCRKVASRKSPL
jgi:hypothetical protein